MLQRQAGGPFEFISYFTIRERPPGTDCRAHPQYHRSLATALQTFSGATDKLATAITPAQMVLLSEMGGNEFFDPALGERIRTSIEKNAMTPAVARDFAQDIATRRTAFME